MTITFIVPWWVAPYIEALGFFAWMTGLQVDEEKLIARVARAIRIELKESPE